MRKACMQNFRKLIRSLFLNMDFKNSLEFQRKYTPISLQRGKLFKEVTFFIGLYSLYLDLILNRDSTIDILYRRTLIALHLVVLVLCIAYIITYRLLKRSWQYQSSRVTKAVIISDMFVSLLIAAVFSLNGQRFSGNIDAYIMVVFSVALVIPMYPKWVYGIYGFVHIAFLIALYFLCDNNTIAIKQFNSTTVVLVAIILFTVLYNYNVKNFLNEEMLKADKATFIKLFEINPFPLMISNFADGKIQYVNQRAMLFYEIQKEQVSLLNHKDFYRNANEVNMICKILETEGVLNNYVVEQKTLSGVSKRSVVNYERIDYFGERSILMGVADIAEIKRIEHELTIHASMDILTGVLNRRVGMDLVRKRFAMAKSGNEGFALCFVDIDDLKMVNDKFGHLEGDSLITDVCRILKEETKPNDVIFRYGGDEFMIVFEDADADEIEKVSHKIHARFEALNQMQYKPYSINASMGMFYYTPEMNLDLEQIIEMADKNMYNNKPSKNSKFLFGGAGH